MRSISSRATHTAEAKSAARTACAIPRAPLLQLQYDRLMIRSSALSLAAVLLLTGAPVLAQPETAPADPTQPETAKADHKLTPETAKDDDKHKPETATDTRKTTKREKDARHAARGVRSNTPAPKHKPPP